VIEISLKINIETNKMDTPTIEKTIMNLQKKVGDYDPKLGGDKNIFSKSFFSDNKKIYIAIPVIILILLAIFRPSILYIENNKGVLSFSYQRFFLSWLSISFVLILAYFGYQYKKSN
jgi:hypothetical protein